jgi:serine phosphatase RsbU (regulator of sigma subunit)/integral membrane sensor domain MASE1
MTTPGVDVGRSRSPVVVPWRVLALVALGYATGSLTAFLLFEASETGPALFASAGVTLAALVLSPARHWPWILLTVALTETAIDLAQGIPLPQVAGFVLANTAEPLVGALLLRRFAPRTDVGRRRDLGAFLACGAVAGPFVGALVGATTVALATDGDWLGAFLTWWAGDGLGAMTVGGAILAWAAGRPAPGRVLRLSLVVLMTVAVTVAAFWPTAVPTGYLTIPVLIWIAVRFGTEAVPAAGVAFALTANAMTVAGRGPWAGLESEPRLEIAVLQLFVAVAVLSAWLLAVEIAEREQATDVSRRERTARRRVEALQEVTAGLATAATSGAIADVVVRHGIDLVADHGAVGVLDESGRLRVWTTAHLPGQAEQSHAEMPVEGDSLLAEALRTGAPVQAQTPAELAGRFPLGLITSLQPETRSALAVPARVGGRTVGGLAFSFAAERAVDDEVMAVAQTLAQLMASALHRARLYEDEHEAAHQLQQAFLPIVPARLPGADIAGCYRPADQQHDIGGDWYDAFPLPDGRVGFVVGDVVGHDLRAAAAMGRLHSALRVVAAVTHSGPAEVLEALDQACLAIPGAPFATIGYGEYDPVSGRLRYACAGHPPPLLVTAGGNEYLDGGRSMPLAVSEGPRSEAEVVVPPGALLVWYSDGLVERRDADLDAGLDRLSEVAAGITGTDPHVWCDAVLDQLVGGQRLADDVVLLCLRFERTS